jgi:PAS domain S-box-containing protein
MFKSISIIDWFRQRSKASLFTIGLVLVVSIGVIKALAPAGMSFGSFYLVPIFLVTWFAGRAAGIFITVTSVAMWLVGDLILGTPPGPLFVTCWNAVGRLGIFLVLVLLMRAIEERFRQVVESIREVFWITNVEKTKIIYISPGYETTWGRTCASLYESAGDWMEAIHREDRDRVRQAAVSKQLGGEYDEEYRIVRPDGSIRWIRDRAFPIRNMGGKVYRIVGIAEDITERKLAEAKITMLAHAVESTSELICITDLDDRFVFVNQAFQKIHGFTEAEILGKTPDILYSPRNPPELLAEVLKQTRLSGWRGEVLDRRKDGTEFPVYLSTSLVKDQTGGVIGLLGVAQDITERKRAEARMTMLAHAVESSSEMICLADLGNRFIFANLACQKAYGYTEAEFIGQTSELVFSPNNPQQLAKEILKQTREGGWRGELLNRRKDGTEFPIHLTTSLVKDQSGRVVGFMSVAQDITERRQFVELLQRQQSELKVLFDLIPAMIWFKDTNNRILRLNKQAAEIAGKSVEEVEGKSTIAIHPQEAARFYADDLEVIRSGLPKLGIVEAMRNSEGKELWVQTDKVPYRDEDGNVIGIVVVAQDITGRRRAEESLRLLGSAVQQSKESIVVTDAELDLPGPRILFVNPAFTNMTGYTADEALGKTPRILQGPRTDRAVLRRLRQSLACGEPFLGEIINYRKDGTEFYLEWQVTPIRDANGATTHFVAIQRDITERKLAEARITTLAHAVESTSELICITDLHNRFTFVNRAFQQTYGYAEGEILGKTPDILFSLKNPPKLIGQITEQTRLGGWRGEVLDRRKDGTEFPISLSTSRIVDESGGIIGLMGVARDITERTRTQEALRESEQRFRTAFGAAPVAMTLLAPDGHFLQVNRALCEMLGYTEKELLVKTVRDITDPTDLDPANIYIDRLLKGQRVSSAVEKRYIHKLGIVVWGRTTASLIRDRGGQPLYFIAHIQDFTDRRRLEREILEISDREQRRIGQDLHDGLCQQLVSTAFATNLLSQQLAPVAPSQANTARQIAVWLDDAISQSRALARGLYPVKLEADGLASALQELAEYVSERFGIACVLEKTEAALLVDNPVATHLYRITQEAVINAVKHAKGDKILIRLTSQEGNVCVTIQDDGIGIPDTITNGMGLHIMQYRARMIGGILKIERQITGGTVVVCSVRQETSTIAERDET